MYTIQKTQQQIINEEIQKISLVGDIGLNVLEQSIKDGYDLFWNNPNATPQELCDLMGNQAYKLFQDHRDAQDFIKSRRSDYVELTIPENYDVTFNQDGTVTILSTE